MSSPCPGCGRPGATCWASPCLYLEYTKSRPLPALKAWCEATGGTLVSKQDKYRELVRLANEGAKL